MLDSGKFRGRREDGHVVELGEEEVFVLVADWVIGGEGGKFVGELA